MFGGTGPWVFLDPRGRIVQREPVRLHSIIRGYERAAEAACRASNGARTTAGRSPRGRPTRDFGPDLNHPTITGHARTARVAWQTLHDLGLMPAC